MYRKLLLAVCFSVFSFITFSQKLSYTLSDDSLVNYYASQKRVYYATSINEPPKIDGKLNDACWQNFGKWDGDFIQQVPHQAKPPSQETEIKVLYDHKYLYVGIICHDNEPEKMSPILGRRDEINGDMTGIAIDSYHDKQTAFEFNLSSAGQKVDLMHLGRYGWDFNWNAVWDGKTSIGDSAWYAEMRIPFSQIRFANTDEHVWGMHIWRWIHRLSEESQWKLIPIDAPAMVYIFGELKGIQGIQNKKNVEFLPYAKAKYIPNSENNENFGFGLDGKIGVSSNFTLDYTLNPDFGQVEADPSELNLTSYEVFYDEKRPFFLEGNNILDFTSGSDMLFYSRRIGHAPGYCPDVDENDIINMPDNTSILNALKLTGKNKSGLSVGIINSMTAREKASFKTDQGTDNITVEPFTNYFIGRVKQDFNKGNTVLGAMVTNTSRNIKDDHLNYLADNALVGGIDFEHYWKHRKYYINAQSFFSKIDGSEDAISRLQLSTRHLFQRKDAEHLSYDNTLTSLSGWGGEIIGGKGSGKLRIKAKIDWRSPGVDLNDVGYMRQADNINIASQIMYRVNKPKGIVLSYLAMLIQRKGLSYGGENLNDRLTSHGRVQFKNFWLLDVELDRNFFELDTRQLRGGPALRIDGETYYEVFLQSNSQKDFYMSGGFKNTFSDDDMSFRKDYKLNFYWLINKRFVVSSKSFFRNEIDNSQYVMQKTVQGNHEYVVGKIDRNTIYTTLRLEYFITPELSLQYYGSPYASSGKYLDFRKVTDAGSKDLTKRYEPLMKDGYDDMYLVDKNYNQYINFTQWNPDFNFQEFRSNFVARWEYKTGSTLYFVWTNNRSRYQQSYNPSIFNSLKGISKVDAQNAFMIKLSYWFSL